MQALAARVLGALTLFIVLVICVSCGSKADQTEEPSVRPEAAGRALVARRLERRVLVEAELLRVVEDDARPELLPDVAEDGVDRVLDRVAEVDPAERARARLVGVVVDAPAVLDAVPGVLERRRQLRGARVDRGGLIPLSEGNER